MKITNYQISDKIGLIILQTLMFVAPIFECSPLSYVDEKTIFDIMPDFSVWGIGSIMFIVLASFIVSHRFVWLISFFVVAIIQCLSVIGDIKKSKRAPTCWIVILYNWISFYNSNDSSYFKLCADSPCFKHYFLFTCYCVKSKRIKKVK